MYSTANPKKQAKKHVRWPELAGYQVGALELNYSKFKSQSWLFAICDLEQST